MKPSPELRPQDNGLPIAFIYQEKGHPPSFNVRFNSPEGAYNCGTSGWTQIEGIVRAFRDSVVFLDDLQLDEYGFAFKSDRNNCRPFSPKRQELASKEATSIETISVDDMAPGTNFILAESALLGTETLEVGTEILFTGEDTGGMQFVINETERIRIPRRSMPKTLKVEV